MSFYFITSFLVISVLCTLTIIVMACTFFIEECKFTKNQYGSDISQQHSCYYKQNYRFNSSFNNYEHLKTSCIRDSWQYYGVLEVPVGASKSEIKQAYWEMCKVWHPDRFCYDLKLQSKAEKKMKVINEAYNKLCSAK